MTTQKVSKFFSMALTSLPAIFIAVALYLYIDAGKTFQISFVPFLFSGVLLFVLSLCATVVNVIIKNVQKNIEENEQKR